MGRAADAQALRSLLGVLEEMSCLECGEEGWLGCHPLPGVTGWAARPPGKKPCAKRTERVYATAGIGVTCLPCSLHEPMAVSTHARSGDLKIEQSLVWA